MKIIAASIGMGVGLLAAALPAHAGPCSTEIETLTGKFVDTRVILTQNLPLTVHDLDAAGNLVTRQITIPAGSPVAFETKALAFNSWDPGAYATAQREVFNGFEFVDPGRTRLGESLVAATADILDDEAKLVALLQTIKTQDVPEYANRSVVLILSRRSLGTGSYNDIARGLIRNLAR